MRHTVISAVHLILEQDNKVLLLRRFNTGYEDGNYSVVAGHIDEGESAKTAMIREAREEAGIEIRPDDLEMAHLMHRMSDQVRIDFFLRAHRWFGDIRNIEPDKCDDLNWFEINALPENTIPYVRSAIEHIQKNKTYSEFGWKMEANFV